MTRRYSASGRWVKSGLVYMCSPFPAFFRRIKSRSGARPRKTAPFAILQGHMRHRVGLICSPHLRQNPAKTSAAARRSAPQPCLFMQVCRPVLHLSRPFPRAYTRIHARAPASSKLAYIRQPAVLRNLVAMLIRILYKYTRRKIFPHRFGKFFRTDRKIFPYPPENFSARKIFPLVFP